jgi:hypothetical protein
VEQPQKKITSLENYCILKVIRNIYEIQKVVVIGGGYYFSKMMLTNKLPKISIQYELFPYDATLKLAQLVHRSTFAKSDTVSKFRLSPNNGDFLRLLRFTRENPTKLNLITWKKVFVN